MAMGRNWYVVPVCTVDVSTQGYHPGEGDGSTCPGILADMLVHAYDPDPSVLLTDPDPDVEGDETYQVPTTCLVGVLTDESSRAGWVSKTLQEAKDYFEAAHGYAPSDAEVS
jgi:hypothetical protein